MSYSATICFKTVKEGELYSFLQTFKDTVRGKLAGIAAENFLYMPSIRREWQYRDIPGTVRDEINCAWARTSIFTHRYFYLPEHNLLGMFSVHEAVEEIFDASYYFQNSTDQDYEFKTWTGIPAFEAIADKWKNATEEAVRERYTTSWGDEWDEECDYDYCRRSFAYDEIWAMCEPYLYDENSVVYLSLFGNYEEYVMHSFVKLCEKKYEKWKNDYENAD